MAKDAYYFKHDGNARNDPKTKALINKYGVEGYGRFWIIIEMLREASHYKLEDEPYLWETLAGEMRCTVSEAKVFIKDCVNIFKLLVQDDGFFYSASLLDRMIKLDEKRAKTSFAANVRHGNETRRHYDE